MSRKDKEQQKQQHRLEEGRCPKHGLPMSQISRWYDDPRGPYCYGACGRRDCNVAAKFREAFGEAFDVCQDKWTIDSQERWRFLSVLQQDEEIIKSGHIEKLRAHYIKLDTFHGVTR